MILVITNTTGLYNSKTEANYLTSEIVGDTCADFVDQEIKMAAISRRLNLRPPFLTGRHRQTRAAGCSPLLSRSLKEGSLSVREFPTVANLYLLSSPKAWACGILIKHLERWQTIGESCIVLAETSSSSASALNFKSFVSPKF